MTRATLLIFVTFSCLLSSALSLDQNGTVISHDRHRRQSGNGCSYTYQFNQVGQTAMLRSPGYPGNYGANIDCRYTISSPAGTRMSVDCSDFNLEASQNCQYDVFFVSLSGDTSFRDQQYFCGNGGFTRTTQGNRLAVGFHSDDSNPQSNSPFRYQCRITVVQGNQEPSCSCGVRNVVSISADLKKF